MDAEKLFNVVVIAGVVGFAAYCASYALHVWRTRNRSIAGSDARPGRGPWWRVGKLALVCGGLLLALAWVQPYATDRTGVLAADGIYTVRAAEGCEVGELAGAGTTVEAGTVLARFISPEREAKAAALALKERALQAEMEIARREPPEPDPELVRRQQELSTERRHLQASRDQLVPARDLVERERTREQMAKQDQLKRLRADEDRLRAELAQATAKKEAAQSQSARIGKLAESSVASSDELVTRRTDAAVAAREVAKLKGQLTHVAAQIAQAVRDLAQLDAVAAGQAKALAADIEQVRERLAAIPKEEGPVRDGLTADAARARGRTAARLEQLDAELRQCRAELDGLNRTLSAVAPFAGRVAFREPAPNNAAEHAPLLVIAQDDAFRLRLRLPTSGVAALQRAGPVLLELDEPNAVERRFEGKLLSSQTLPLEPGYSVAEIACDPPAAAVRRLGDAEDVAVAMRWVPPVHASPLFRTGLGVVACGVAGCVVAVVRGGTTGATAVPRPTGHAPAPRTAAPGTAAGTDERAALGAGAVAPMLMLLGSQLREAIARDAVDDALLASVEWALDRHHVRAVRLLGGELGDDESLADAVAAADGSPETIDRLHRVVRTVGGPRVRARLRSLEAVAAARPDAQAPLPGRARVYVGGNGNGNGNGNNHRHAPPGGASGHHPHHDHHRRHATA